VYESNQYGLIYVGNGGVPDQLFLQSAGCATLTPFASYPLPPFSAWKLAATGCQAPNLTPLQGGPGGGGTVDQKGCFARVHYTTCAWAGSVLLVFSNWVDALAVGDYFDNGGANKFGQITFNGTICYPDKATVVGSFSGIASPGLDTVVGVTLNTPIPQGAKVYIGTYAVPASGCGIPLFAAVSLTAADSTGASGQIFLNTAIGEAAEIGASQADKTATLGTLTAATTNYGFLWGPSAILAVQPINAPVFAIWSDSEHIGFKYGAGPGPLQGSAPYFNDVSWFAQALTTGGQPIPCLNFAVSGQNLVVQMGAGFSGTGFTWATSARERLAVLCGVTHAMTQLGANDVFSGGRTGAQVLGDLATLYARWKTHGWFNVAMTLLPQTSSTDGWVTTTNQSVLSSQANLDGANLGLRASPANVDLLIDAGAAVSTTGTGTNGKWPANWTPDGVHPLCIALPTLHGLVTNNFTATIPAYALSYIDTYMRGVWNVQSALDYLLSPADLGKEVRLASATLNFNTTADQVIAITGGPANYVVTKIIVRDGSIATLSAAQGAFYSTTGKVGPLLGTTTTTPYADVTYVGGAHIFSGGTTGRGPTSFNEVVLSLTTPQGAAATAVVDVYGVTLAP
jgi:hypothetical protein